MFDSLIRRGIKTCKMQIKNKQNNKAKLRPATEAILTNDSPRTRRTTKQNLNPRCMYVPIATRVKNIIFTCGDSKNHSWPSPLVIFSVPTRKTMFFTRESLQFRGYASCFVVVAVAVAAVACLLVLYSIKQFVKLPLQQGSHASMQFGMLPLHQGSSVHSCMQFVILPLQQGSSAHSCMQFGILPLHYSDCSLRTAVRTAACAYMQFENLSLQPGSSHVAARVCMQRGARNFRPVDL
jgi:hypothetical protein